MTTSLKKPIGIFGGTFNPVHKGHLSIATHVLKQCQLEHIEWVPCNIPAHRKEPAASTSDRLNMLKLATKNNPAFHVNDCEIKRGGISYMIDTIESLQIQHPNTPLCLILGADAFEHLDQWHRWDNLLDHCHIIVINRENYSLANIAWLNTLCRQHQTNNLNDLHTQLNGKIYFEKISPIAISATIIRNAVTHNERPIDGLPENVYNYIITKQLYLLQK